MRSGNGVRRTVAIIAVVVATVVLGACVDSGSSSSGTFGKGRPESYRAPRTIPTEPPAGSEPDDSTPGSFGPTLEGMPSQPATMTDGVDACRRMAEGPWKEVAYGTDPLDMVRSGATPQFSSAPDAPILDEVVEFPTLDDYDDPSTLLDPVAVRAAFDAAGFREGVAARHVDQAAEVSVTALRFRDPAAARSAMSAHLRDYCGRAVSSAQRPQGNGMVVVRDQDAVRTFFVLGDVEVSVFVCRCFYSDTIHRSLGVQWWTEQVEVALLAPDDEDLDVP